MIERLSTPDQADELATAMREFAAGSSVITQPGTGDYAQRYIPMGVLPADLKAYLLQGVPIPDSVDTIVKVPVDGMTPEHSLRLSWEYDPARESAIGKKDSGDLSDWRSKAAQRGVLFTNWRVGRNPDTLQRVSGLYDQCLHPFSCLLMPILL